ncbi:MAG: orotate phosphoribosyltransferase [Candidatus Methylomirabilia bacterium]
MEPKDELFHILTEHSLLRGRFVLASGKESDYYFDCKLTTLGHPRGLSLACRVLRDRIRAMDTRVDAIGGPSIGAAPLVIGISFLAQLDGQHLPGFIVRKDPKPHGRQRLIEGIVQPDANVVIVEDVVTTGSSVLKAVKEAEAARARVVKVLALIDREEGADLVLRNYDFERIFSFKEFPLG